MAIKARDQVTIAVGVDVASVDIYYKLQLSTATPPIKPSTANPSGWSTTEPTYDSVSTNTLYTCQKTTLTDGTFYWSSVSKSTSYEAAKTAWNLANSASSAAAAAQSSIDDLQVGGRNLLPQTKTLSGYTKNSSDITIVDGVLTFPGTSSSWFYVRTPNIPFDYVDGNDLIFSFDYKLDVSTKVYIVAEGLGANVVDTSRTRFKDHQYVFAESDEWTRWSIAFSGMSLAYLSQGSGDVNYFRLAIYNRTDNSNLKIRLPKLEKGNKATDWSPAPEDLASASDSIEYIEGTQTGATGAWTGSTKDSALYAGKSIAYKLPYAGSGNATLSLVLGSVDIPSAWTDDATGSDVTGVNLLKNSSTMSVGASSSWANGVWRAAGGPTGMTRSRVQITDGPNGSCYGVQGVGIHTNTMDATCWGIDIMPRTANGIYTFSFYARVVGGGVAKAGWNVGNAIKTIDTNATETFGTAQYWLKTLDSSGAWTRVWATVCATTTAADIYIGVIATDTTSKTVQICNVKIEKLPTAIAPVYLGTTRMTTHFGAGSIIQMTYDGANWRATSIPNTNNIDRRLHNNAVYAVSNITSSRLICGTEAGYRDVASAATFDLSYPILYASAAITATNTATNTYEALPSVNFSTTGTIEGGAAYKQLYLKGTVSGNIFTVAASPFLTTVQPTTANGCFYIPIGVMASATNGYFATSKDLYAYTDGAFRQVNPATIVATQKIYYRSNAESSGTGVKPNGNGLPTTWVTNTSNTFNTTATNASGWSTKVSPLTNDGVTGSTKYLYLWTCEQRKRLDGTVAYTDIVLDENTTVIDGGRIITNSITANKLNAANINASKTLTVGALTDAAAETILNSNVVVGGRNLLQDSKFTAAFNAGWWVRDGLSATLSDNKLVIDGSVAATGNKRVYQSSARFSHVTGVTYTFSCDIVATAACQISFGRRYGTINHYGVTFDVTTTSKRISGTYTATNNGAFCISEVSNSATVTISNPKLEKGNKATDWSPAPEDVDADISKAAQTATNFLTTVDSTGLLVHRANNTNSGVKITDDVDIIRGGTSIANYGSTTRIGPTNDKHLVIDADSFDFIDNTTNVATLELLNSDPNGDPNDVTVNLRLDGGFGNNFLSAYTGQVVHDTSSDTTRLTSSLAAHYYGTPSASDGQLNLSSIAARSGAYLSDVYMQARDITIVPIKQPPLTVYNASLDNLGHLIACRAYLAGGDITIPANGGASATWPWQGSHVAGTGGSTAVSFPDTNYIVVIGKSGNGQIAGFDKVDFMVTGKTESQVTIAGWNSYSQAVTIHVVCIGFNSRYGSRA